MQPKVIKHYSYDRDAILGRGAFSVVYKGHHTVTREQVAVKVMTLSSTRKGEMDRLLREVDVMTKLHHPHIVQLYDVVYERHGTYGLTLYLIMEYCAGGDFSRLAKPLDEQQCCRYFSGIINGLRYLRASGFIHRDIKPKNVLMGGADGDTVKIADFTFARQVEQEQMLQTVCGTPLYMAPEILLGTGQYGVQCDLWSLGIMLYEYLYGTHPFGKVDNRIQLMKRIRASKITFPNQLITQRYVKAKEGSDMRILQRTISTFSNECVQLVRGLLRHNPNNRMTWDQLVNHSWLLHSPIENERSKTVNASSPPAHDEVDDSGLFQMSGASSTMQEQDFDDSVVAAVPMSMSPLTASQTQLAQPPPASSSRLIPDYCVSGDGVIAITPSSSDEDHLTKSRSFSGILSKSVDVIHKMFSIS